MRRFSRLACLAAAGALVLGLALGGCGRKGGLDAPPSAAVGDAPVAAAPSAPSAPSEGGLFGRPAEPPEAPAATPAARRTFLLDWLLN